MIDNTNILLLGVSIILLIIYFKRTSEHFEVLQENKYVIYSILPGFDGEYVASFIPKEGQSNNNLVTTRSLKSNSWSESLINSAPHEGIVIVDLCYDKDKKLLGIGMELVAGEFRYSLYKKETIDYKSKWLLVSSNEEMRSVVYDVDDIMIGCHAETGQIYKKRTQDISSDWYGPINYDLPMKKVMFDKDGVMIGIGKSDNKIYKKEGYFWDQEKWDTANIGDTEVYDLIHDNDGCFIATTSNGILKQDSPNYMSKFIPFDMNYKKKKSTLSVEDILKYKCGFDLSKQKVIDYKGLDDNLQNILKFKKQSKQM